MSRTIVNLRRATCGFFLLAISASLSGCLTGGKVGGSPFATNSNSGSTGNSPPDISGNPPSAVVVGNTYRFSPRAIDPDGDPLSFSIENKPAWATFDTSTGTLSGTAPLGTEGTYDDIRIVVSDGTAIDSTNRFSVDVVQSAIGSITVSWQPPTQNEDGSYLYDLQGHKIYLGSEPGVYDAIIDVPGAGITTYVIESLVTGTYYLSATSYNSSGLESDFSNEVAVKTDLM